MSEEEESVVSVNRRNSDKKIINPNYLAARASFTNPAELQSPHPFNKQKSSALVVTPGHVAATRSSFSGGVPPIVSAASSTPQGTQKPRSSFHVPVPDVSANSSISTNKNWQEEIIAQRKDSVKDITARFKGSSRIETMAEYEQRLRAYKRMKTINYFQLQNTDLKSLSKRNKVKIMQEWKTFYVNEKMGDLSSEAAKEFLSQYDLTDDNLSTEQWSEWLDAIETTLHSKSVLSSRSGSNPDISQSISVEHNASFHSDSAENPNPDSSLTPSPQSKRNGKKALPELDVSYGEDINVSYDSYDDDDDDVSPFNSGAVSNLESFRTRSAKKRFTNDYDRTKVNDERSEALIANYYSNSFLSPSKQTNHSPLSEPQPQKIDETARNGGELIGEKTTITEPETESGVGTGTGTVKTINGAQNNEVVNPLNHIPDSEDHTEPRTGLEKSQNIRDETNKIMEKPAAPSPETASHPNYSHHTKTAKETHPNKGFFSCCYILFRR